MTFERTFVAIKPDAVRRGLIGEIISRFEKKGFKITAMKMLQVTEEIATKHYEEHIGKPFYPGLIKYITSAPIVAMVIEGVDAISNVRHILGKTNPAEADVGTIRADYGLVTRFNVVHGSDSVQSAEREIAIYFKPEELCEKWQTMMELVINEQE